MHHQGNGKEPFINSLNNSCFSEELTQCPPLLSLWWWSSWWSWHCCYLVGNDLDERIYFLCLFVHHPEASVLPLPVVQLHVLSPDPPLCNKDSCISNIKNHTQCTFSVPLIYDTVATFWNLVNTYI